MTDYNNFKKILIEEYNIQPQEYLKRAKSKAKAEFYNPNLLKFSTSKSHKLSYNGKSFGHKDYKDFIIYSILYKYNKDYVDKKRNAYLARAKANVEKTNDNESKSHLSYYILW